MCVCVSETQGLNPARSSTIFLLQCVEEDEFLSADSAAPASLLICARLLHVYICMSAKVQPAAVTLAGGGVTK